MRGCEYDEKAGGIRVAGELVLLDLADYERLCLWRYSVWISRKRTVGEYSYGGEVWCRLGLHGQCYMLNRLVTGSAKHIRINHSNGDKHDCRRENLRLTSEGRFGVAAGVPMSNNQLGIRGVSFSPSRRSPKKYRAVIKVMGKVHFLGWFATTEEAKAAYDRYSSDSGSKS